MHVKGVIGLIIGAMLVAGCGSGDAATETFAGAEDASATARQAEVSADLDLDFDPAAIVALLPPAPSLDRFEVFETDEGPLYAYAFPTQQLNDGVALDLTALWQQSSSAVTPVLEWTLTGGDSSPSDYDFVASLPKSWASHTDDIIFPDAPDEIIETDPVFRWVVDLSDGKDRVLSIVLPALVDPTFADDILPILLGATEALNLHHSIQICRDSVTVDTEWANSCFLSVIALNPNFFDPAVCRAMFSLDPGQESAAVAPYRQACNVMVGLSDPNSNVSCDTAGDPTDVERCRMVTFHALAQSCEYLSGFDEQICLYDAVAASGDLVACGQLADPAMANDCRATVSNDPSYCAAIEDEEQRLSCCSVFAGTDQREACAGDASVAAEDTATSTTTTTTAAEALPPLGGNIASPTSEGFEAVYSCGNSDRGIDIEYETRYFWDGRMMVDRFGTAWDVWEATEQTGFVYENDGAIGLVVSLDGTTYGAPADSFDMATDEYTSEIHMYSPLAFTPGPATTLDLAGWDWPVVPFTGGFTHTIDYESESLGVVFKYEKVNEFSLASWHHAATGLLMQSSWSRNQTVDTTDSPEIGILQSGSCRLVSTTLDLSGG